MKPWTNFLLIDFINTNLALTAFLILWIPQVSAECQSKIFYFLNFFIMKFLDVYLSFIPFRLKKLFQKNTQKTIPVGTPKAI